MYVVLLDCQTIDYHTVLSSRVVGCQEAVCWDTTQESGTVVSPEALVHLRRFQLASTVELCARKPLLIRLAIPRIAGIVITQLEGS